MAGKVQTAEVLKDEYPELARICLQPEALLKQELSFGKDVPVPFDLLASTYDRFAMKSAEAGLQVLRAENELHRVNGHVIRSGALAVTRDPVDRVTSSLEIVNALVDPEKLPKVECPYLGCVAVVDVAPEAALFVSKRNATNYCPSLACGGSWQAWFGMPPLRGTDRGVDGRRYPCHTTWPRFPRKLHHHAGGDQRRVRSGRFVADPPHLPESGGPSGPSSVGLDPRRGGPGVDVWHRPRVVGDRRRSRIPRRR